MLSRRHLMTSGLAIAAALGGIVPVFGQEAGGPPPPPANAVLAGAIAVTRVYGDGQRLIAVALAYDRPIATASVRVEGVTVAGRTVLRAYANVSADPADVGRDGNFVMIELSPDDASAKVLVSEGRDVTRLLPQATVQVTAAFKALEGSEVLPMAAPVTTNLVRNLVVDDFQQGLFQDPETGIALAYNLFLPTGYDPTKTYPLVLFMHDAGVTGPVVDSTLVQGLGAVAFASPETQAKTPCFVLAPQYDAQIANDASETTPHMAATVNLLDRLVRQYRIDPARLYATGQSGGGMTAIAMNLAYPDLFAASLLVACQWDATLCAPLAKKKLWVVVSQGDTKAYPGQNAIMDVIEAEGATVARAVWDGRATPEVFAKDLADLEAKGAQVNYAAFAEGTVALPGDTGGAVDHRGTWRIAYGIEGLRDWLLRQTA